MYDDVILSIFQNLRPHQQTMFKQFFATQDRKVIWHAARRIGKSYTLSSISLATCYSQPNAQVRYATFTRLALKKMIFPIIKDILKHVPKKYHPVFNTMDSVFTFPNGSQLHLAGVEGGNADSLRGTASNLCVVDEAAFLSELSYLVESVLMPQLLTVSSGKLLMASSSPLSPSHEFADYVNAAKVDGTYSSYDIYAAGYDQALINEFCKEAGGVNSTTWQREYENKMLVDETMAIVPEWDDKYVQEIQPDKLDSFWHRYEAMDLGVRDKTAVLFGKYIFNKAQLYVEQVWTCSGQDTTTKFIAENVRHIESELGYSKIYQRIADNNSLITLNDLNATFGLYFGPTSKDSLAAMVNEVRLWVQSGRLIVHPRCQELIDCLKYGVYQDNKRKEFGRSKSLGHYDALAALVYMIRNINQTTNPVPKTHGYSPQTHHIPPEQYSDSEVLKIFNIK